MGSIKVIFKVTCKWTRFLSTPGIWVDLCSLFPSQVAFSSCGYNISAERKKKEKEKYGRKGEGGGKEKKGSKRSRRNRRTKPRFLYIKKKMPASSWARWKEQQTMCRYWILSDPPTEAIPPSDGQGILDILSQTIHSKCCKSPKKQAAQLSVVLVIIH